MNSVNFKISNSKLRKRYQVCVGSLSDCHFYFLLVNKVAEQQNRIETFRMWNGENYSVPKTQGRCMNKWVLEPELAVDRQLTLAEVAKLNYSILVMLHDEAQL